MGVMMNLGHIILIFLILSGGQFLNLRQKITNITLGNLKKTNINILTN